MAKSRRWKAFSCLMFTVLFAAYGTQCRGGERWGSILDVVVRGGHVYVATTEKGGLYSLEHGRWESLGGALPSSNLFSLRISPKGNLFLSTYDEALFSKDGGVSWTSLKGGGSIREFFFTSRGTYLLADWNKGILRYDGSSTKPEIPKIQGENFFVTGFSEGPGGILWASTFGGGMLRSDDDGSSWSPFNQGLNGLFVLSMALSDKGELYVGTMEGGVFGLKNGEWIRLNGLPEGSVVQAMACFNGVLFAGTLEGLFLRREKEREWTFLSLLEGDDVPVRSIAPYRDGVIVGTGDKGIFYLGWDLKSSRPVQKSDAVVSLSMGNDGVLWALSESGRLFESEDGTDWSELDSLPEGRYGSLARFSNVAIAGESSTVYSSSDGSAWASRTLPLRDGQGGSVMVVESNGTFIAGLSRGGLFRSSDWGICWDEIDSIDGSYIYSVVSRGKTVAVGTDRGFSVSRDGGRTWENRYIVYGVNSLAIDGSGYLWAASRNGLWRWGLKNLELDTPSIDGFSWSPFNYFTDVFSGRGGDLMGLLRGELVRLSPVSADSYLLERSSLSNNDGILTALVLPDRIVISTGRGLYSSVDEGLSWMSIGLPVGAVGR